MDRQLLSKILGQMKSHMMAGKDIGNLKISALLSLGHQLEAIFYYLGHELGTILDINKVNSIDQISQGIIDACAKFNIGEVEILESTQELIQLNLKGHSSSIDLIGKGITSEGSFCSFEAGLLAGIVEKMSNIHCFAQELNCCLQTDGDRCKFMIVFQKE
ncbi:MAG: hypothetical protein ACTSR8_15595 [Promethearchaeota archaeon]